MAIDTTQTQQPSQPSLYGASLSRGGSAGAAAAANAAASTPAAAGATEGEHISRRRWEGLAAAARVTDELPADDDAAAAAAATTLGGDEIPAPHLRASHHPSGFTGLDESYTRDPARLQDENYANIFAHFLQTYRREPGEADDDDENAPWPEDPVLEAQRPATGDAAGSAVPGGPGGEAYYMRAMANLLQDAHARRTLVVKLHDVERWQPEGAPVHDAGMRLAEHIRRNYIRIRCRLQDVFRLLMEKLAQQLLAAPLQYTFFLQLRDTAPKYIHEIGSLRCNMLGRLLSVRGQVTRSTDVRPELLRASFKCLECGYIEHDVEQCFRYTQPKQCRNTTCNNTINWELMMERSQCGDWQKLRVQEPSGSSSGSNSNRRSPSSVPRSIDLILRHDLVDSVYAGDIIIASGALIAIPDVAALVTRPGQVPRRDRPRRNEATLGVAPLRGLSSLGVREMQFKICMLVIDVQPEEINGGIGGGGLAAAAAGGGRHDPLAAAADSREVYQAADFLGSGSFDWLREVAEAPDTLDRLVKSVAPRVWGYEDVKKGILLLMTGGVQKTTANARLRGDINMCLVGDPSTSKSQLLSWVTSFAPRSVFASGKGSTAAGLTAAVVRDSDQGDYVLEAGALMYADQGICCIDEFDKMDEKDRVAIHEAMEQQTISISKAGIQATLNARASVLAACNPRFGRYDKSKSFSANVNIPPPLLSRFDLFFTLLDEACDTRDAAVFDHVVSFHLTEEAQRELHQRKAAAAAAENQTVIPLTADELRVYIQCAQKLKPLLTDEAKVKLAKTYTALRLADAQPGMQQNTRITVRQLESLVRLSEAVARLKFSDFVKEEHVDEAVRIFRASLQRIVYSSDIVLQEEEQQQQQSSALSSSGAAAAATATPNTEERAAAGGAGGAGKSIRISQEEYRRISCQFIEYISRAEREADISTHTIFEGVRSSSLIEWWLDEILQADDPAALEGWAHKLLLIIRRLVAHDGYLVAETIEGEEEELLLRVHPNLSEDFYDVNQLQFHAGRGGGSRAVLGGSRLVPPAAAGGAAAAAVDPSSSPSPHLSAAAAAGSGSAASQQSPRRPGAEQQRATAATGKARRGGGAAAAAAARGADIEADQEGQDEEEDELMMADLTQENFEQLEEHTQQTQTQTLDDY